MKNFRKNAPKSSKGITLIALVITIIVLLILAGISISMLSGDNSILQKATTAKENSDKAQIEERIRLAYHSALVGGQGSYTKESLENELEKEFKTDYSVDDSGNDNWILYAQGQRVTIKAGEKEIQKTTIKCGTTNLKEVSDLSTLYGQITDYVSIDGVEWQLFLDDDTYIYLIASDYVPNSLLGEELIKTDVYNTTYNSYFGKWNTSTRSYVGTIMENTPWSAGTVTRELTSNPLTAKYLRWIGSGVDTIADNPNMKAVAYMMDRSKWSNFAGEAEGAYAIGGPTVEMFVASYNAVTEHITKLGTYDTITNSGTDANATANGYKVKLGTDSWNTYSGDLDSSDSIKDSGEGNMWVKTSYSKAYAYWLASPSSADDGSMCFVYYDGYLYNSTVDDFSYGFRPLIAIPKSSLK
ncbi:MAG TPA: hypothetical protein DEP51_03360 [Clostridiales bacterium]|nr:hypothetical protein [Clostridiales bacterium]